MKYILKEGFPPMVELTRRNLTVLLHKLNDPDSMRTIGSPGRISDPYILVKAVEDEEHYSDRAPGAMLLRDTLTPLIEQLKDEQHKVCAYGTREGDGGTCDCKYTRRLFLSEDAMLRGETTGCCELRAAIQVLETLQTQRNTEEALDRENERLRELEGNA